MTKPVIVYGASGYTGRLICEYLREFNVPFVAAGRDKARIQEALDKVPGIDTVEHEIVEVSHDVQPLADLFEGAEVVCNTVGPFAQYGREVVEACLNAGCHYLDTTGEQDWLITCDEDYGRQMAAKGLLLAPGIAQMYTTGEIAAQLCLEKPGVDTLDILVFWKGMPTIASTRTILVNAALSKACYLEQNSYVEWPADAGLYDVVVPGQHETGLALPWGGTSHPVWFKRDPRVANVKVLGGVFNRALMLGVPQIVAAVLEQIEGLPENEKLRDLPTLIYMLLDHDRLAETDTTSLQCLWYGAAPMSASRLEEALARIGPVLGQLFGQSEAPMMISTLAPAGHFHEDGSLAKQRLSSAGRPTPLTTVAIMDDEGNLLGPGQRGEIVVRGPLVMAGYYKNPQASAEAARHGWHHTGDIGYLDEDGYLFIVDRAKDMIITGGFNAS